MAYAAFQRYRDSPKRRLADHGPNAMVWSATWQWGFRCLEWDRYMARVDAEDLVRYRREMNDRHRTVARLAIARAAEWLSGLTPERISRMRAAEVARMLEVASRLEREAAGVPIEDDMAAQAGSEAAVPVEDRVKTLADLFGADPEMEYALSKAVHEALRGQ